ncbi:hypothetical protein JTB14_029668 [Gonioctena quinquepunctata]|nr:hypothetical protein JTB14_029668 [Gonioctena quinquepunctata]
MDNLFGHIECFNVHSGIENIGARWEKWIKRLDNFLIAAGIVDDDRKEAMLLHCMGEEIFEIYCALPNPQATQKNENLSKYEKAKLKVNEHFIPRMNEEFEIFYFRQAKQYPEESIDKYYARLLKLSSNCNF